MKLALTILVGFALGWTALALWHGPAGDQFLVWALSRGDR